MKELINSLRAEIIKSKNSFAVWMSLLGTIANVLIFMGLHLADTSWQNRSWTGYITGHYDGIAFMMLPLYVIILATLVTFLEHRRNMWVQLNTLPVGKRAIYLSKFLFLILLFLAAHLLFIMGFLLSGYLVGLFLPDAALLQTPPPWLLIARLAGYTFISILGLAALHYWMSIWSRHFIVPLTIGILGFVLVSILGPEWEYGWLVPYAAPIAYMPAVKGEIVSVNWLGLDRSLWMSILYMIVFLIIGFQIWKRRSG